MNRGKSGSNVADQVGAKSQRNPQRRVGVGCDSGEQPQLAQFGESQFGAIFAQTPGNGCRRNGFHDRAARCGAAFVNVDGKRRAQAGRQVFRAAIGLHDRYRLATGFQLQERQRSSYRHIRGRQPHVENQLGNLALKRQVRVADLEVETVLEAKPEAQIELPRDVQVDVSLGLEAHPGNPQVEADSEVLVHQIAAQRQVPLHEHVLDVGGRIARCREQVVLQRVRGDIDKGADIRAACRGAGTQLQQIGARGTQHVEQQLRDDVLVIVVKVERQILGLLHTVSQWGDQVLAEIPDKARTLGQLVTDQRHRYAADVAVENTLDAAEHHVEPVDRQKDLAEDVELGKVEIGNGIDWIEDIYDDGVVGQRICRLRPDVKIETTGDKVGQVAGVRERSIDIGATDANRSRRRCVGGEEHRQHAEYVATEAALERATVELVVVKNGGEGRHTVRKDICIESSIRNSRDFDLRLLVFRAGDPQGKRAQAHTEGDVLAADFQFGVDPCVVEQEHVIARVVEIKVLDVDAHGYLQQHGAFGNEVCGAGKVKCASQSQLVEHVLGKPDARYHHIQAFVEGRAEGKVEPQDPVVLAIAVHVHRRVVGQIQHVVGRGRTFLAEESVDGVEVRDVDSHRLVDLVFQELQRPGLIAFRLVDGRPKFLGKP